MLVVVTPSAGFFRFLSAEHLKAGVLTAVMNRLRLLKIPVRKFQFGNQWTVFFGKTPSIGSILAPLPTALLQISGVAITGLCSRFSRRTFKSSG